MTVDEIAATRMWNGDSVFRSRKIKFSRLRAQKWKMPAAVVGSMGVGVFWLSLAPSARSRKLSALGDAKWGSPTPALERVYSIVLRT